MASIAEIRWLLESQAPGLSEGSAFGIDGFAHIKSVPHSLKDQVDTWVKEAGWTSDSPLTVERIAEYLHEKGFERSDVKGVVTLTFLGEEPVVENEAPEENVPSVAPTGEVTVPPTVVTPDPVVVGIPGTSSGEEQTQADVAITGVPENPQPAGEDPVAEPADGDSDDDNA